LVAEAVTFELVPKNNFLPPQDIVDLSFCLGSSKKYFTLLRLNTSKILMSGIQVVNETDNASCVQLFQQKEKKKNKNQHA
jgi:hypothetical protein